MNQPTLKGYWHDFAGYNGKKKSLACQTVHILNDQLQYTYYDPSRNVQPYGNRMTRSGSHEGIMWAFSHHYLRPGSLGSVHWKA